MYTENCTRLACTCRWCTFNNDDDDGDDDDDDDPVKLFQARGKWWEFIVIVHRIDTYILHYSTNKSKRTVLMYILCNWINHHIYYCYYYDYYHYYYYLLLFLLFLLFLLLLLLLYVIYVDTPDFETYSPVSIETTIWSLDVSTGSVPTWDPPIEKTIPSCLAISSIAPPALIVSSHDDHDDHEEENTIQCPKVP